MPPPLHQASISVSPELAPASYLESDARDAMLRMCELSDVNPPQARRGAMLTVAVPTLLWAEAVLVVASLVPL